MAGRGRGRGRAPPTGGRLFLMRSAEECGFDSRNLRSLQDITRPQLFPDIMLHSSGDNKMLRLIEIQKQQKQQEMERKLLLQEEQEQQEQQQQQQQQEQGSNQDKVKAEPVGDEHVVSALAGATANAINETVATAKKLQKQLSGIKRSSQTLYLITKGREIHHRIQNSAFHVKATKDVPDIIRYSDSTKPPSSIDTSSVLSHCLSGRKRTAMGVFVPEELVSGQKLGSGNAMSSSGIDASIAAGRAVSLNDMENANRDRLGSTENADGDDEEDDIVDEGSEEEGEDYVADYNASDAEESDGGNEATF
jgi:hypothetical protein